MIGIEGSLSLHIPSHQHGSVNIVQQWIAKHGQRETMVQSMVRERPRRQRIYAGSGGSARRVRRPGSKTQEPVQRIEN